jgi:hypothetical protein
MFKLRKPLPLSPETGRGDFGAIIKVFELFENFANSRVWREAKSFDTYPGRMRFG